MSYQLKTKKESNFLSIFASGARTKDTILSIVKDMFIECEKYKISKVLLDICNLKGELQIKEMFDLPEKHFPKLRNHEILAKAAILDLKENEVRYRKFELFAQNRDFNLSFFNEETDAITWLSEL